MKRAAIYTRVSTEDQKDNYSLPGQLEACRDYAAQRGYSVVAEFQETYSGATLERPELDRLRDMLDTLDVVIVREVDRLARKLAYITMIEDEFQRRGVPIEYVVGYEDTPEGRMLKNMQGTIREYERDLIFERTKRGRHSRARSGKVNPGGVGAPYGYRYEDGSLVIHESEAEIVRLIFNWYVYGDDTGKRLRMYSIAERLSAAGVPTRYDTLGWKRRFAVGRWNRSTVCKILDNETYAGTWHYNKRVNGKENRRKAKEEWIAVDVPAIVDRATFDLAQQYRKKNKVESKRNTQRFYLLRSRLKCTVCGCKFESSYQRYRCPGQTKHYDYTCKDSLNVDQVDTLIWNWLTDRIRQPEQWIEDMRSYEASKHGERYRLLNWLASLEAQKTDLQTKEGELLDLYLSSGFDRAVLDMKHKALIAQRSSVQQEIATLEVQLARLDDQPVLNTAALVELCQHYAGIMDRLTPEERLQVIEVFDIRVTVTRGATYKEHIYDVTGIVPALGGSVHHVWMWWTERIMGQSA